MTSNSLVLQARISEREALRYTPAGLPALNMRLEHESQVLEAGQERLVKLEVKAVALGTVAERLEQQSIGTTWTFQGFLAAPRSSKGLVFHIQEFSQD